MSELRYYTSDDQYCLDLESAIEVIEDAYCGDPCDGETIDIYAASDTGETFIGTFTIRNPHPTSLI